MPLPHVLLVFRHRYNPIIHRAVARHAGRRRWHLSLRLHLGDSPLAGLSALQGVLIADTFGDAFIDSVLRSGVPVVNLCSNPADFPGARVIGDNAAIGRLAAEHLLERHHRHFVYYGEQDSAASDQRRDAFAAALAARGHALVEIDATPRSDDAALDWSAELACLHAQLSPLPAPLAVFCFNDLQASHILDAALQFGRLVPEEINILGVDDDPLICETSTVPLSSVRHPLEEVGARGAELLEAIMAGRAARGTRVTLPPRGVATRRSTDFVAVEHPTLRAILLHLDRHHHGPLVLPELAAAVGVSPRTVQQLLQTHLRSTLTEELLHRRIAHACRLLAHPGPSVAEIAASAGFVSTPHFHHAFKRRLGQTPRQYRETLLRARETSTQATAA